MDTGVLVGVFFAVLVVIAIYFFRRRRLPPVLVSTHSTAATDPKRAAETDSEELEAVEVFMSTTGSSPVISVSALPTLNCLGKARRIEPDRSTLDRLSPLLQAVPSVLTAVKAGQGQYMQVIVNGPLAAAADGKSLLPFVREANGRISALARLKNPQALSNLINAGAIFQIASVVVAQKHLADISRQLDDIKLGVARIQAFQQDQRKSGITGALKYFDQVAHAVLRGELSASVRQKLEDYEAQLLAVQDHLITELRRETADTGSLKDPDSFGTEGLRAVIAAHQTRLSDLHEQCLLCLRARAAGWQLLSAFPGELHLKEARQQAIQTSMDAFLANQDGLLDLADMEMAEKIDSMKSQFNRQATIDARKATLKEWSSGHLSAIRNRVTAVGQQLTQGTAMLREQKQPLILAMKVEAGVVVEAYHLER